MGVAGGCVLFSGALNGWTYFPAASTGDFIAAFQSASSMFAMSTFLAVATSPVSASMPRAAPSVYSKK